ncbi:MAG: carboxyl-terminal processing protease [Rhodothermales bacterium]|jgi:carboxyl-terminal processing protease
MLRSLLFLGLLASCTLHAAAPLPPEHARFAKIATVVARIMTYRHFEQLPLDDTISQRLFDGWLDTLDPDRNLFRQTDIDALPGGPKKLDEALSEGNIAFAFAAFETARLRSTASLRYIDELITQPIDFQANEFYEAERSSLAYAKTDSEWRERWRRQLKHDCLNEVAGWGGPPDARHVKIRVRDRYEHEFRQQSRWLPGELCERFLTALTHAYDPHSAYLSPATEQNFDISMSLSLEGIGAYLQMRNEYATITGFVTGGPADLDGRVQPGDRIIAVSQEEGPPEPMTSRSLAHIVSRIRGVRGSRVYLTLLSENAAIGGPTRVVDLVRDSIKLAGHDARDRTETITRETTVEPSPLPNTQQRRPAGRTVIPGIDVDFSGLEASQELLSEFPDRRPPAPPADDILVVELPSFYTDFEGRKRGDDNFKSTARDVLRLINRRDPRSLAGLILDLRGNPGGSLAEAVELTGLFLTEGPVVQIRDALSEQMTMRDRDGIMQYKGPLVVLVDSRSASATELVAAALQDAGRAVILGDSHTYGKGTVQIISPLVDFESLTGVANPGSIRFTNAKFYRISGDATQRHGVTPDLVFASYREHRLRREKDLPHALPWDAITAKPIQRAIDIRPHLPRLREQATARLAASDRYQKARAKIEADADRPESTKVPLQTAARQRYESEQRRQQRERVRETLWIDDYVMDQAMLIIRELIDLQRP